MVATVVKRSGAIASRSGGTSTSTSTSSSGKEKQELKQEPGLMTLAPNISTAQGPAYSTPSGQIIYQSSQTSTSSRSQPQQANISTLQGDAYVAPTIGAKPQPLSSQVAVTNKAYGENVTSKPPASQSVFKSSISATPKTPVVTEPYGYRNLPFKEKLGYTFSQYKTGIVGSKAGKELEQGNFFGGIQQIFAPLDIFGTTRGQREVNVPLRGVTGIYNPQNKTFEAPKIISGTGYEQLQYEAFTQKVAPNISTAQGPAYSTPSGQIISPPSVAYTEKFQERYIKLGEPTIKTSTILATGSTLVSAPISTVVSGAEFVSGIAQRDPLRTTLGATGFIGGSYLTAKGAGAKVTSTQVEDVIWLEQSKSFKGIRYINEFEGVSTGEVVDIGGRRVRTPPVKLTTQFKQPSIINLETGQIKLVGGGRATRTIETTDYYTSKPLKITQEILPTGRGSIVEPTTFQVIAPRGGITLGFEGGSQTISMLDTATTTRVLRGGRAVGTPRVTEADITLGGESFFREAPRYSIRSTGEAGSFTMQTLTELKGVIYARGGRISNFKINEISSSGSFTPETIFLGRVESRAVKTTTEFTPLPSSEFWGPTGRPQTGPTGGTIQLQTLRLERVAPTIITPTGSVTSSISTRTFGVPTLPPPSSTKAMTRTFTPPTTDIIYAPLISKPTRITRQETRLIPKIESTFIPVSIPTQVSRTRSSTKTSTLTRSAVISTPIFAELQLPKTIQTPITTTTTTTRNLTRQAFGAPGRGIPTTPRGFDYPVLPRGYTLLLGLPSISGFGSERRLFAPFKGGTPVTGYVPDFSSFVYQRRGTYKRTKYAKTGLDVRPITSGFIKDIGFQRSRSDFNLRL